MTFYETGRRQTHAATFQLAWPSSAPSSEETDLYLLFYTILTYTAFTVCIYCTALHFTPGNKTGKLAPHTCQRCRVSKTEGKIFSAVSEHQGFQLFETPEVNPSRNQPSVNNIFSMTLKPYGPGASPVRGYSDPFPATRE